jgi:hypothetical protein
MPTIKSIATAAVMALAVAGSLAASAGRAEARSYHGGAIAAGIVGGVALGVMAAEASRPRVVRVVRVRKAHVHRHGCGCHHHRHRVVRVVY